MIQELPEKEKKSDKVNFNISNAIVAAMNFIV